MSKNPEEFNKFLENLRNFASGDPVTNKRFNSELKKVAQYIANFQKEYMNKLEKIQSLLEKKVGEIDSNNSEKNEINKSEINTLFAEIRAERAKLDENIKKRLSEIRDGKDADEDSILERVIERVKEELFIPTTEDLLNNVPILAERIRDSLELLQEDDRLDVSAIKGIEELLKDLQENFNVKLTKAVGSIQVPSPVGWTKHQRISLSKDTYTYSLSDAPAHEGMAAIVRYQGQVQAHTTHYTFDGTDITLTFNPLNGTFLDVTYWPF